MNTQATPAKAERLTEEEVHAVCARLIQSGQKATIVNVFNELKRGSMTTIKKFIDTFNDDLTPEDSAAELQLDLSDPTITTALNHFLAIATKKAIDNTRAALEAEINKLKAENEQLKAELLDCQSFCEKLESIIEEKEEAEEKQKNEIQKLELKVKKTEGLYHELEIKHSAASAKIEVYEAIGGTSTKNEETTTNKAATRKKKEKVELMPEKDPISTLIDNAKNALNAIKKEPYLKIAVREGEKDKILITAPYYKPFVEKMHKLNGEWKGDSKEWEVLKLNEDLVRKELINTFGVDDSNKAELCTLRLSTQGFYKGKAPISIAGRIIAEATGRDSGVKTKGTSIIRGDFRSTGSVKNWATEAMPETEIILDGFFADAVQMINNEEWTIEYIEMENKANV